MMPQHSPALNRLVCRHCGGFPVVAITTGTRQRNGSRTTLRATCPVCKGTGRAFRAAVSLVPAGRS
ncbi:hypothetical protein ACWCPS_29920 [Streptomyces mauvecolor]